MTVLQLNGSNVAAAIVSTGFKAAPATGGTETTSTVLVALSSTGWLELSPGVTGTPTPAGSEPTTPSGKHFFFDATTLVGNTLTGGTFTVKHTISQTRTMVGVLVMRVWLWNGTTYTQIGSDVSASSQTLATAKTTYTYTGTIPAQAFTSGQYLSYDFLLDITTGPLGGANTLTNYWSNSGTTGVAGDGEVATQGYVPSLTTSTRTVPMSAALLATKTRTVPMSASVGPPNRTVPMSTALIQTRTRTVPMSASLNLTSVRSVPMSAALLATKTRTVPMTAALTIPGPTSGGFALYANGTGVASFDDFRVTAFPDPSLACEPAGRAGSSYVGWNANLPTAATTVGIDTSTRGDGTDWVDVSAQNGGPIPGIFTQPDPTTDGFSADTSALYTSTFRTGGSVATVFYDLANSRLILTGGSMAIYYLNSIARADIDELVIMDQSDAGGLVLRFQDQSNFYRLVVADDSSNVGTASRLTLYKVLANVDTLLAQATISFPRGTFHAVRVSMLGGVITAWFDGTVALAYTDPSPFGAGNIGLRTDGGAVGSRYYMLWVQPQGDLLLNTYVYTRQRLDTSDVNFTGQLTDITTSVKSPAIESGPVIPQLHQLNKPFAEYIDKEIQSLADTADKWWGMDDNKALSFRQRQAVPAPWPVSESDLVAFTVLPAYSGNAYRNRQTIINVVDTIQVNNEQKVADGTATSWAMGYRLAGAPTITVGGVNKSVGVKGIDTNKDFYWLLNDVNIVQDSNAALIPNLTVISVTYLGNFDTLYTEDRLAEQTLRASIEQGTSGIVENVVDGAGIPMAAAIAMASGLLTKFAKTAVTLVGSTRRWGLLPGMLANVFILSYPLMFDRQLLITKVVLTPTIENNNTVYIAAIEATDGPSLGSWSRVL